MKNREIAVFILTFALFTSVGHAGDEFSHSASNLEQATALTMDRKIGNLKQAIVALSRDLVQLEKDLLFPANTQISVFLSLPIKTSVDLQSVQLNLDGNVISNHIYTARELNALSRGGVHRVYMGNLSEGEHLLGASIIGTDSLGNDYNESASLKFNKENPSKFIELTVVHVLQEQQPEFVIKEWQ